jgi:hypothetical protein
MDEEAERMVIRERLLQLLQGPLRAGMIGDITVLARIGLRIRERVELVQN